MWNPRWRERPCARAGLETHIGVFGSQDTQESPHMVRLANLSMAPSAKQRRYQRIGLPRGMFVAWRSSGDRIVSRVATLGLGGLFINTPDPPAVGELIQLYFEIPGGEVRARAVIRVSDPGEGMGVEFTAMSPEARGRLDHLLRRLVGDAP